MRLGDLDALFCQLWQKADPFKEQPSVKPSAVWSEAATLAREAPTIDPETIPIVRQLRAELARVKAERDAAVDVDKAILWLERYAINDSEEVYTNGSKLVPYFRVLQALKDRAYNGLREG